MRRTNSSSGEVPNRRRELGVASARYMLMNCAMRGASEVFGPLPCGLGTDSNRHGQRGLGKGGKIIRAGQHVRRKDGLGLVRTAGGSRSEDPLPCPPPPSTSWTRMAGRKTAGP